jgi:hypothetical protein
VVETLNRYYVPVYAVNEDYENGVVPPDEQKERQRIWNEASEKKLPWGMVCSYFLNPKDGHLIETGPVAKYNTAEALLPLLEKVAQDLKTEAGKPVVPPSPQSTPLRREPGGLTLYLTARYVDGEGNLEPLGRRHTYHELPGESWVVLAKEEGEKLAPPAEAKAGTTWEVDPGLARKILIWFYPVIEDNANLSLEEHSWKARVLSADGGTIRVRFDGSATVKHLNFYNRAISTLARTTFAGYLEYDVRAKHVKALELATDQARYADNLIFGVAVRAVPEVK